MNAFRNSTSGKTRTSAFCIPNGSRSAAWRTVVMAACLVASGCGALERAAARDPQRCERDPNCSKKRGRSNDCNTQCADNPACVDRCREIEVGAGTSGR
jgi:hypothetical protein